ncbi:PAP2 superfamily protein [Ancylomarina subtilis]|uniref:PAP2 superfamily protein n=1 Tax=Ancylomarina subtilis TaxID=1639035 RepID=A0A4Q7VLY5_9BACT|nr:phosphatase PAP2 family protein [Ancylomarina subtilis]RZT97300.1 PAP2 superfamily protein [Ancylomarina subtilis]
MNLLKKKTWSLFGLFFIFFLSQSQAQLKVENYSEFSSEKKTQCLNPGLGKEVFSKKNLLVFGGLLGSAFLLDEWVKDGMTHNQNSILDGFTDISNEFGEKKYMAPATLATWVIATAIDDERLATTAMNSAKALICGAVLTESTKFIAGRSRPDMNRGSLHFAAFNGNRNGTKSFPSGHAFVAWSVFTPFAQEYSKWFYVVPAGVSLARMYRNRHWFSDVVLGGGIGYFAGLYFHKRKNQKVLFNGNGIVIKF